MASGETTGSGYHTNPVVRWKNFRSFEDTGSIELTPLTLFIGPNNSGKSSILAPLLILKQTFESSDNQSALITKGPLVDAGNYKDLIFNHEEDRELSFSFQFHRHHRRQDEELEPPGAYAPGELELHFTSSQRGRGIKLLSYRVRDIFGRNLLRRDLLPSGRYSRWHLSIPSISDSPKYEPYIRAIREENPVNFYFDGRDVILARHQRESDDAKERERPEFPDFVFDYTAVVGEVQSFVSEFFGGITYLGPIRARSDRLYQASGEFPVDVGVRGENAPELLYRYQENLGKVNKWIDRFEFGEGIKVSDTDGGVYRIELLGTDNAPSANIADVGSGVSQILPLIIEGYLGRPGGTIVAEQPEIHLNPKQETILAELFTELVNEGKQMIIESHSEHLLLSLRRLVAEGKADAEDISIYYVEQPEASSKIREISLLDNGHIPPEEWPEGFFEDSLKQSLALSLAGPDSSES